MLHTTCTTRVLAPNRIDTRRDNLESALSKELIKISNNVQLSPNTFRALEEVVERDPKAAEASVTFDWPSTTASHDIRELVLAASLKKHFGLLATQYLANRRDIQSGPEFSPAARMAIGLYTNGHYHSVNSALRADKKLDPGPALIDKGLGLAFANAPAREGLLKTHRGTEGRDAFERVPEGKVGREAGYLSTTRHPAIAKIFGTKGPSNEATVSTIFGQSGLDVSHVSIEGDEQEILFNKDTEMSVLLSAEDRRGTSRQVLEEVGIRKDAGRQPRLVDALALEMGASQVNKRERGSHP